MTEPKINKVDLLDMALNIAAIQALKTENLDIEIELIKERKEYWME